MNRFLIPVTTLALLALVMFVVAACTFGAGSDEEPVAGASGPRLLYVAVGASETVGVGARDPLREAWPQVLYRTALPATAEYVNLGIPGATVAEALRREVPYALDLAPDLVSVWLNVNDILAGVSPASYERDFADLVSQLRRDGATRVLVANTPPLDRLPALIACQPNPPAEAGTCPVDREVPGPAPLNELVEAYNEAIQRVAASTGAEVVDLHSAGLAARRNGTEQDLVSRDGFHPSSAGHRLVAQLFFEVIRQTADVSA